MEVQAIDEVQIEKCQVLEAVEMLGDGGAVESWMCGMEQLKAAGDTFSKGTMVHRPIAAVENQDRRP
jgi:hypothetical protein